MSRQTEGLAKFALGVLVGAGLGVLFAPKSGEETREELKASMEDLVDKAKHINPEDVKLTIEEKIADIKAKCEDLVEYAKDKGTPVVEKTARDMRSKAIEVVKNVLDKLEAEQAK